MSALAVLIAGTMALGWGASAGAAAPSQALAGALVVARRDVPGHWSPWRVGRDPVLGCLGVSAAPPSTAKARAGIGTPNSGIVSQATVFATRSQAAHYYRAVLKALPGCVEAALASRHPAHAWHAQSLPRGRYGVRSTVWRIRYTTGSFRHGFDWAVMNTGTAVLVDLFDMGSYDSRWRDISAARGLGGSVAGIERSVLASAAARAASAS